MKIGLDWKVGLVPAAMLILTGLVVLPASTHAAEIWLEPAKEPANSKTGNWATANLGGWLSHGKETHFAFHVPDDFVSFTTAKVVLIPDSSSRLDTEVKVNVARKGQPHYWNERPNYRSQTVAKNVLTEVDVTSTLRNAPGGFAPSDYVTLTFKVRGYYEHTRVVGMRFQYVSPGGPIGPTGPSGPQGNPGPVGPTGPEPRKAMFYDISLIRSVRFLGIALGEKQVLTAECEDTTDIALSGFCGHSSSAHVALIGAGIEETNIITNIEAYQCTYANFSSGVVDIDLSAGVRCWDVNGDHAP